MYKYLLPPQKKKTTNNCEMHHIDFFRGMLLCKPFFFFSSFSPSSSFVVSFQSFFLLFLLGGDNALPKPLSVLSHWTVAQRKKQTNKQKNNDHNNKDTTTKNGLPAYWLWVDPRIVQEFDSFAIKECDSSGWQNIIGWTINLCQGFFSCISLGDHLSPFL